MVYITIMQFTYTSANDMTRNEKFKILVFKLNDNPWEYFIIVTLFTKRQFLLL